MNENDYKNTLSKISISNGKKNDIANNIIISNSSLQTNKYRPRGKQAAILVMSMLAVYAVVFTSVFMFTNNNEQPIPPNSIDTTSKTPGQAQSDSSYIDETSDILSAESEDNSSEPEVLLTLRDLYDTSVYHSPKTYVVTSLEQLEALDRDNLNKNASGSFSEADLSVYDDEYFTSGKYLIITYFKTTSISFRYELKSKLRGNELVLVMIPEYTSHYLWALGFNCYITEVDGVYNGQEIIYVGAFNLLYLYDSSTFSPATYVITSPIQLEVLDRDNLNYGGVSGSFFDADLSVYDDEYFASGKYLIITHFLSSSSSYRYKVEAEIAEQLTLSVINIKHIYAAHTAEEGFNCYITEVDGVYSGQEINYKSSELGVMRLRALYDNSTFSPAAYVITSPIQLEELGRDNFNYASVSGSFFEADLSVYDDEYFASSKYLIITHFTSRSGSFRYEVDGELKSTDGLLISVRRTSPTLEELKSGLAYTDDIGFNCFITEVEGSYTGQEITYHYTEN